MTRVADVASLSWRGVFDVSAAAHRLIRDATNEEDMEIGETLYAATAAQFRAWLTKNHRSQKEIWLVIFKKSSGRTGITYDEAVDEALCFGWIDVIMKSMDAEKYAQRFVPRRTGGNWTEANRAKARRLIAAGKMTAAGEAALPPDFQI